MPSTSTNAGLGGRIATKRNLTIAAALLVGVPTASAFQVQFESQAGNFPLLMTLAVGVPTAYDGHWPQYEQTWKALAWILAACTVATVEFTGLYVTGTDVVGLSEFPAAAGAFLLTYLGGTAVLARWHR